MFFSLLVLAAAFLIEGIGTYVSVIGLSALFASNPIIILLAIALDIGKVVSVTFLYKKWKDVNLIMKSYMSIATVVLMIITSAGCFGYLSGQFQKAIAGTNSQGIVLKALEDEQGRLQHRKEEIDAQIAKLPDNMVAGRRSLMKQFGPEVTRINDRLVEIDKKLPELKVESIKKDVEVGPILYVAQAFDTDPEHAVKWVILTIIFVFDPLAIALLLAGNFLIEERSGKKNEEKLEKMLANYDPSMHHEVFDDYAGPLKVVEPVIPDADMPIGSPEWNAAMDQAHQECADAVEEEAQVRTPIFEELHPTPKVEVQPEAPTFPEALAKVADLMEHLSDHELHLHLGRQRTPDHVEEEHHEEIPVEPVADPVVVAEVHPDVPVVDADPVVAEVVEGGVEAPGTEDPVVEHHSHEEWLKKLHEDKVQREVITMEQIVQPPKPKPVRSSLEDVSDRSDVTTDDSESRAARDLRKVYTAQDHAEVVAVGGPPTRLR